MKFGLRKPNLKKSIKAKTTGQAKRKMKSAVNPFYGKKGTGLIKDPKKSAYNKIYSNTTESIFDDYDDYTSDTSELHYDPNERIEIGGHGCLWWIMIGWWWKPLYYLMIWWWWTPLKWIYRKFTNKE